MCDIDAYATEYEITLATYGTPGFACDGRGTDYGDWVGILGVHFSQDIRKDHGQGGVVSHISCKTEGKYNHCNFELEFMTLYYF